MKNILDSLSQRFVEVRGFEPLQREPKSLVLPLHHTSKLVLRTGIEPVRTISVQGILSPSCLPISPPKQESTMCFTTDSTLISKNHNDTKNWCCDFNEARTRDPNIKSVMLYQLSYEVNIKVLYIFIVIFNNKNNTNKIYYSNKNYKNSNRKK